MADDNRLFPDSFHTQLTDVELELGRIEDLAGGVARSVTLGLRGAILEGRSLKGLLGEIGRSFADIALKAALKPVGELVGGFVETALKVTNPAVTQFAKGGVIAAPTYFPMRGGFGLAGEAGAEAILPLSRGSNGRLGVASESRGVSVTLNVQATDARSFAASEAEISAMLLRAVKRGQRAS